MRCVVWFARWGFAALVFVGTVAAAWAGSRVALPREIPSFALQAAAVYRVEVGAAVFAAVYLASMAVALALNNRAFSDIGTSGVKAQDINPGDIGALRDQAESLEAVRRMVIALHDKVERNARRKGIVKVDDK